MLLVAAYLPFDETSFMDNCLCFLHILHYFHQLSSDLTIQVTISKERSSSCEADSCWAGQKIYCLLMNLKVYCYVDSSPITDPSPEPNESCLHPLTVSLRPIVILSSHMCLRLASVLFPSGFLTKTWYPFFISHLCYMLHASHLPWFDHPSSSSSTGCLQWNALILSYSQEVKNRDMA
jgi:hypothetical protein